MPIYFVACCDVITVSLSEGNTNKRRVFDLVSTSKNIKMELSNKIIVTPKKFIRFINRLNTSDKIREFFHTSFSATFLQKVAPLVTRETRVKEALIDTSSRCNACTTNCDERQTRCRRVLRTKKKKLHRRNFSNLF